MADKAIDDRPNVLGRFEHVEERTIYEGHVMRLVTATFRSPTGEVFSRDAVRSRGAVGIVAVRPSAAGFEAAVVRQYRPVLDSWLTEIPAGMRDRAGEEPVATAARELAEESGLAADRYTLLTTFANAAGMTDQRTYLFLAESLRAVPQEADGIEEQYLEAGWVNLADVPALIRSGELSDAKTIIGLLLAREHLDIR